MAWPLNERGKIQILVQNNRRLEWQSWTWTAILVFGVLAIVSLFFGIVALVEGELAAAAIPVVVSLLAIVFFAFFAGKRRVLFDKDAGEITVEFRSLLRHRIELRDFDNLVKVLLYKETGEGAPEIVVPKSRPSLNGVRYRAALAFRDGSELNLNGNAAKSYEPHRIVETVKKWLGDNAAASVAE